MPISFSTRVAVLFLSLTTLFSMSVWGQKSSGAGSAGSSPPVAVGTRGTPTTTPNSTTLGNTTTSMPSRNRPIFLMGAVMFDDGTPPTPDIRVERVCNGNPHLEAHTDSKGRFSFQIGGSSSFDTSAEDSSIGTFGQGSNSSSSQMGNFGAKSSDSLWSCELRAAYPGFKSDVIELASRQSMDDPNLGTIVLHRLVAVKGTTISLTSALAPKPAQKSYEKGLQLLEKGKFEEAEPHLAKAAQVYPQYAAAWFALGQVQHRLNKLDEAQKSYLTAAQADAKYVSPYDQLALLSAQQGKWEDAAKYSKQAIYLNPVEFPSAFWYNALSNYRLKNDGEAEKSARELVKVDSRHRYPEVENMLAEFAMNRGDLPDAAAHLRAYLNLVPNAKNADKVKKDLARIEEASASTASTAQPAAPKN